MGASDPPARRFTVPLAPTANSLFVNRRGGRARSPQYLLWQDEAGWLIKSQRVERLPGKLVRVLIEAPINYRRDLDNITKPTLDLLVKLGIIADDRYVDDLRIVRLRPSESAEMVVSLWPIS